MACSARASILCVQETKLDSISHSDAIEIAGAERQDFFFLPANGTRGGIGVFWNEDVVSLTAPDIRTFSVTATVTIKQTGTSFVLSSVYGPVDDDAKLVFLDELRALKPPNDAPWIICGDFNLIYEARDKNNLNLNRRLMGQFRAALDSSELRELRCQNRSFSWSNERAQPTLVRLDRFFCTASWEALFRPCAVHALSSSSSDHCPLLLADIQAPPRRARFRFESFWPRHPGFHETVLSAWNQPLHCTNPLRRLRIKFCRTARALKQWSKSLFSDARFQLHLAEAVVFHFDVAQESRPLTPAEHQLRKALKLRILGLAAVEHARRRQASRLTWMKEGDANTRFFHLKINARRRKSHIHALQHDNHFLTTHAEKEQALHEHFSVALGSAAAPSRTILWESLDLPQVDGGGLDIPFTAAEIWAAIKDSPTEKAPGPDGFTGMFYRSCWPIIRSDIVAAFGHVYRLAAGDFAPLNRASICLLPKKQPAIAISDFRPISLIHSFSKLFAKVLARRLSSIMGDMVSPAQTAFLQSRSIHESFLYVRNRARSLHRKKKPLLLVKLDFARAFDSVSWEYLLELLQKMGFPPRWRD